MPRRLRRLFRLATGRSTAEADAQDEVALHLALATEELIRAGFSPEDAARRAAQAFGDERRVLRQLASIDFSQERRLRWRDRAHRWAGDAKLAIRGFRREPWFAVSAILLIGLAIGVNAIAFSVFETALLRPLPYPDPDRLVWVAEMNQSGRPMKAAGRNLRDWQRLAHDFTALAGLGTDRSVWGRDEGSEFVELAAVSRSFETVMGVRPLMGRWFSPEEARLGGAPAAVVSERFWRSRLGADPDVVGRVLRIGGKTLPVVGVMPARLDFPLRTELWIPAEPLDDNDNRTAHNWGVVGRLRSGVSAAAASGALSLVTRQLVADEIAADPGATPFAAKGAIVTSLQARLVGSSRELLWLVQATVTLLLLVAALNLTSLLLARTARRQPEVALTVALGARRGDLVRRFVVESVLLTGLGAAAGGLLWWSTRGSLLKEISRELPSVTSLPLDLRLLVFLIATTLLVGLAAGLLPAVWVGRSVERGAAGVGLRVGGRATAPDRMMRWLVGAEVATTFVLLFGAGLLGKSLSRLLDVDPGFQLDDRAVVTVQLPGGAGYEQPERTAAFYERLRDEAVRLPGVIAAGFTETVPLRDFGANGSLEIQGDAGPGRVAEYRLVGPGFFGALEVPVLTGRSFAPEDGSASPLTVIVNQAFGREELDGGTAIGRVIRMPGMRTGTERWASIVGVVADVQDAALTDAATPTVYYDYRQQPPGLRPLSLVVHAAGPPAATLDRLQAILTRLDPGIPFQGARLTDVLSTELATPRLRALVISTFALAALVLAGFGLFAVLGFIVVRRTGEFGVRIALGASRSAILRAALRPGLAPVLLGIGAGGAAALLASRLMRSLLYGVPPGDPLVWLGVAAGLMVAAALAGLGPALRATRTDPIRALRNAE